MAADDVDVDDMRELARQAGRARREDAATALARNNICNCACGEVTVVAWTLSCSRAVERQMRGGEGRGRNQQREGFTKQAADAPAVFGCGWMPIRGL